MSLARALDEKIACNQLFHSGLGASEDLGDEDESWGKQKVGRHTVPADRKTSLLVAPGQPWERKLAKLLEFVL